MRSAVGGGRTHHLPGPHRRRLLYGSCRSGSAIELLDRALQRQWITVGDLARRVQGHFGRRGARRLVRLLGLATSGARSAAERLAAQLLRQAGIGGWVANAQIRDGYGLIGVGDIVFSHLKLVIEIDGRAFHVTPEQFQADRERQNRLVAAGWTVLRFTWRDLTERPAYVIGTIRAMLAELGARRGLKICVFRRNARRAAHLPGRRRSTVVRWTWRG